MEITTDIAIIEDDDLVRESLAGFLGNAKGMSCTIAVPSVELFLDRLKKESPPDVLLSDIGLPGMSGIEGIRLIKDRHPEVDIIMLTVHDDAEKIFRSLCAGASGYLLKNTPFKEIKVGIETLRSGGAPMSPEIAGKVIGFFRENTPKPKPQSVLTEKEHEVVVGLVDGLSYKLIADRMSVSVQTVQVHIKNVYRKLHVHSKGEVIAKSLRGEI